MYDQPRIRRFFHLIISLVIAGIGLVAIFVVMPAAADQTVTASDTVLFMGVPGGQITTGEEITVTVFVSDVVGLYGIQFTLNFNPADLQVIDADPLLEGVQITPAECPLPELELVNSASNISGTIQYAVSQLNPTQPVNGNCAVAHINFSTLISVTTPIQFEDWLLSDNNFNAIPAEAVDLNLEIQDDYELYLPMVVK